MSKNPYREILAPSGAGGRFFPPKTLVCFCEAQVLALKRKLVVKLIAGKSCTAQIMLPCTQKHGRLLHTNRPQNTVAPPLALCTPLGQGGFAARHGSCARVVFVCALSLRQLDADRTWHVTEGHAVAARRRRRWDGSGNRRGALGHSRIASADRRRRAVCHAVRGG